MCFVGFLIASERKMFASQIKWGLDLLYKPTNGKKTKILPNLLLELPQMALFCSMGFSPYQIFTTTLQ